MTVDSTPREPVPEPPTLDPELVKHVRTIHAALWAGPYREGEGPMHFCTGDFWPDEILMMADHWERYAAAARIVAPALRELCRERERTAREAKGEH